MVVLPADLGCANELDDEGEEVEYDKGWRDPAREAPQGLEGECVGGTAEPDDSAKCCVACCGEK